MVAICGYMAVAQYPVTPGEHPPNDRALVELLECYSTIGWLVMTLCHGINTETVKWSQPQLSIIRIGYGEVVTLFLVRIQHLKTANAFRSLVEVVVTEVLVALVVLQSS